MVSQAQSSQDESSMLQRCGGRWVSDDPSMCLRHTVASRICMIVLPAYDTNSVHTPFERDIYNRRVSLQASPDALLQITGVQ